MDMGHRDALIHSPLPQLLFCPLQGQAVDIEATNLLGFVESC